MDLPEEVGYGTITSRILVAVRDEDDLNLAPDGAPVRGHAVFTPSIDYATVTSAATGPQTIAFAPIVGVFDGQGYLSTPHPESGYAMYRGLNLVATDDSDLSVTGWTWKVTYQLEPVAGKKLVIPEHSFEVPAGSSLDLAELVPTPSSPGYGLPQAEAAALRAEAVAQSVRDDADSGLFNGTAATVEVGTVTNGENPSVVNVGTNSHAVLNFVLAKGDKGDTGIGIPDAGTALQVMRMDESGAQTEWFTPSKNMVGLGNVDNTKDVDKPVSAATQAALDQKASNIALAAGLLGKADLQSGKVPVAQLPDNALVTDSNVAGQVNGAQTGAAIDQRINTQVSPVVEQITADYIASDQTIVDAAAAAVNANPKLLALEAAIPVEGQRAQLEAIATAEKFSIDSSPTGTVRNLIPNAGPYAASPSWLSPNWGTGGAGTRAYAESPNAASGRGYTRNTWTTSATTPSYSFRTLPGACVPGKCYAGSISVSSTRTTVLGAVLYFYDIAGVQIASGYNRLYDVQAGVVTRLDVNGIVAPAGSVTVRLSVNGNPARTPIPQAGDILDLSAAIVTEGGRVPDFFDGDSKAAYWAMDDHSTSEAVAVAPRALSDASKAPVTAGARSGDFHRSNRLYMPLGADVSSLRRRIRDALDSKTRFKLAWLGHSIVAGQGGTPGNVDNVRLLQQRAAQAGTAVTGMVTAVNNTTTDARVTFDPEWESIGAPRTNMQLHRRCLVAGKTFAYKSDTLGNTVDIYTFGNGSAVTYSINGSEPVAITPSGVSAIQVTTVSGLTNAKHNVVITSTSSSATYLLGISVRRGSGLEISNFGYSGSIAYDWTPTYFTSSARFYNGYNGVFTSWNADAAIIQLGANELIHGFTADELKTNLNAIITAMKAAGKDAVLVLDPPVEDATRTTWFSQYVPAVYDVADTQAVPLVDFTAHWINRAVADAQGFYYDSWHPNVKGYYNLHEVMTKVLLP